MKKWAWAFAAASVVVIGCGGSGGGNGSSGGNGGNGGNTGPVITLGTSSGVVTFEYLTGAGRAIGDPTAIINHVSLTDLSTGTIYETIVNPEKALQLNGYTINTTNLSVPGVTNNLLFEEYPLEIFQLKVKTAGGYSVYSGPNGSPLVFENFPAHIQVFPGRTSNVAIRLDETMFDFSQNPPIFSDAIFMANNTAAGTGGTVNSYLADYVEFDLSGLNGTLPILPGSGGNATKVYFTGDNYAVSTQDPGEFDVLTPIGFVEGVFTNPTQIGGSTFPGVFTLLQPDPRDPDPGTALRITALQGTWRRLNQVVGNLGSFAAISMPSSKDDNFQTILFMKFSGSTITGMYFGLADLDAGTISAYPIDQVSPGSTLNEIDGTITNLRDKNGIPTSDPHEVRRGDYTLFDGTGTVPADFDTSGTFVVFRR